jgi:hypothetical protein
MGARLGPRDAAQHGPVPTPEAQSQAQQPGCGKDDRQHQRNAAGQPGGGST